MSLDSPDYTGNVVEYRHSLGLRRPPGPPLEPPGGGGSDEMEARVKALETHIEYVRDDLKSLRTDVRELRSAHDRDFRIIFVALMSTAMGLAGLIAKGFKWL
jgi:hypothetical protein